MAGKYCVEHVLGVGGMGVVVRARHTTLDQIVAIKFLVSNGFDSREEAIARFLTEARAAARIESDHVCRVFDVGTLPSGVPFMVMEHLEGNDLDDEIVVRGQIPLVEAVDYVMQAADAIAAAHQLGIVHRDLKPANIFLARRPDGSRRVKVLDFGISKAGADPTVPPSAPPPPPSSRSREVRSLGSPAYMAPEQVSGHEIDPRTDIWGLGAILYEAITGQMAFNGPTVNEVLDMVLRDDPCPMRALRHDTPPEVEQIVMRCLSRSLEARWPSAPILVRALSPWGTPGAITQLASVQRELGSHHSMHPISVRTAPHSMEPMVANIPGVGPITQPDPEEVKSRESIAMDWTRLNARKRMSRSAMLVLGAATLFAAAVAVLLWMATATPRGHVAATSPPPASALPAPATPNATTPATPATPATPNAATPATPATPNAAPRTVGAATPFVQSTSGYVQTAPMASSRGGGPARPHPGTTSR